MITHNELLNILQGLDFLAGKNLAVDKDLREQDIDSLDMIQVLFHVQEHYNIEIDEEAIANKEWSSIDKMVKQLNLIVKK